MAFQFDSLSDFFNMGGYAFFVWTSFICTFLCMAAVLFHSVVVSKKIKHGVQQERARAERIMAARAARKVKQQAKPKATPKATHNAQNSNNVEPTEVIDEPKT